MFEKHPLKSNSPCPKQSQYENTIQFAKIIGNQAIIQFGQDHHVIPRELHENYSVYLNGFDEDTTVEINGHSGSHPGYTRAVASALDYCITNGIDCGAFAHQLTSHIIELDSVKDIDYQYLLNTVIPSVARTPTHQTRSGTPHTATQRFDPTPPRQEPHSSFGRVLKSVKRF